MESISYSRVGLLGAEKLQDSTVSVIIPVYNLEATIARCMDSILAQTWVRLEILAIDDGSIDRSCTILTEYEKIDERVHLIIRPHVGVSSARNTGIRKANGEYILFVDGDDQIEPDMIEKYVVAFTEKTDIVLGGIKIREPEVPETVLLPDQGTYSRKEFLKKVCDDTSGIYGYTAGKMYRRRLIDQNHLLFPTDMDAQEDFCFALSAYAVAGQINCILNSGYCYFRSHYRRNVAVSSLIQNQIKLFHISMAEDIEADTVIQRVQNMVYTSAYYAKNANQIDALLNIPGVRKCIEKTKPSSLEKQFVIGLLLRSRVSLAYLYFRCRAWIKKLLLNR